MSSVDQRIARMELDNSQFEKAARQTISTLNDLDKSLELKNATNGLKDVERTANSISLSTLANGVGAIQDRFDVLGTFAGRTLERIADDAYAAGKRILNALTLEPLKSGFQEYETQINAVQTILANTSSKGTGLDDVNAALDELNTYADKTIYNFTEMTRNIGTFTAAGIDLDTSVQAIKGIANLAAVSGSTSQQASTAMYQLSQALSAGTVKLQDWNSVVNAGMGGQVFQDALKETARLHGVAIDQMIEEEGSFRNTLQKGWLTSEVLTDTLEKFTGDLSEQQLAAMGYTQEQIEGIIKMGQTANDAATKVKTFTQLFDTLKEAMQSGWTQSWEIIIGDFEEAKELLTSISDLFSGIIGESAQRRNDLLEGALGDASTVVDEFGALVKTSLSDSTIQDALTAAAGPYSDAVKQMITDSGSFEESLKQCWLTSDILNNGIATLAGGVDVNSESFEKLSDVADRVLNGEFGEGEAQIKALTDAGYDYAEVQKVVTTKLALTEDGISKLSDEQIENTGYTREQLQALKDLANESETSGKSIIALYQEMTRPSGRDLIIDSFRNALTGLGKILGAIKEAWESVFPPATADQLYSIIERINDFSKGLILNEETLGKVQRVFKGLFSILKVGVTIFEAVGKGVFSLFKRLKPLAGGLLDSAASIGDFVSSLTDSIDATKIIEEVFDRIGNVIDFVSDKAKGVSDWFKEKIDVPSLTSIQDGLNNVGETFDKIGDKVSEFVSNVRVKLNNLWNGNKIEKQPFNLKSIFEKALGGISEAFELFKKTVSKVWNWLLGLFTDGSAKSVIDTSILGLIAAFLHKLVSGDLFDGLSSFGETVSKSLEAVKGALEAWQHDLQAKALIKIAVAVGILAGSLLIISKINPDSLSNGIAGIAALMAEMVGTLVALDKTNVKGVSKAALSMIGVSAAVWILAKALDSLSEFQSWDDTWPAIQTIGLLLAGITAAAVAISKFVKGGSLILGAAGIVILSLAVRTLAGAIKKFEDVDDKMILTTMKALGIFLGEIALFSQVAKGANLLGASLSVTGIALGLLALYASVKLFGNLDEKVLEQGLISIGIILGGFVAFAGMMSFLKMPKISGALIGLAAALILLTVPIKQLGSMDTDQLAQGLAAFAAMVGVLAVGLAALGAVEKYLANIAGISAGLILFAAAMSLMVIPIKALGSMDISTLIQGMLALVGVIAVFGGAAVILSPFTIALYGLAGALALLGVAMLGIGAGIAALSIGLTTLAASGALNSAFLTTALEVLVTAVLNIIPLIATTIAEGFLTFATTILEGASELLPALEEVLLMLLDLINAVAPDFMETVGNLIVNLLKVIADKTPDIVQSGIDILMSLLRGIRDNIAGIVDVAVDILLEFIGAIADNTVKVIDAGFQMIIDFMNGLADAIRENLPLIIEAAANIADAIIDGIVDGLLGGITKLWDTATECAGKIFGAFKDFFGIASPAKLMKEEVGKNIVDGITQGIGQNKSAENAADSKSKSILDIFNKYTGNSKDAGEDIDSEMASGITSGTKSEKAAASKVKSTEKAAEVEIKLLKDDLGKYFVQGITNGITEDMSAEKAAEQKAKNIADAFKDELDKFDMTQSINDLEYKLWSTTYERTATDQEKSTKKIENIAKNINVQMEAVNLAQEEYNYTIQELGDGSEAATEAYEKLLQAQIDLAEMWNEVEEEKGNLNEILHPKSNEDEFDEEDFYDDGYSYGESVSEGMSASGPLVQSAGAQSVDAIVQGILNSSGATSDSIKQLMTDSVQAISEKRPDWVSSGTSLAAGLSEGITAGKSGVISAAVDVAVAALTAANQALGVASPSKEFEKTGLYSVQGLANGFRKYSDIAERESRSVAGKSLDACRTVLSNIASLIESGDIASPVIRPVVDMSNVDYSIQQIDSTLSGSRTFGIGAYTSRLLRSNSSALESSRLALAYGGSSTSNNDGLVVREIRALGDRFDRITNTIGGMQVVMDKNAVVGQISRPMDASLGRTARYKERGI